MLQYALVLTFTVTRSFTFTAQDKKSRDLYGPCIRVYTQLLDFS